MALRYPGGIYDALGNQTQPEMSSHDIVCVHTMVGYLWSTAQMFREGGFKGTESHFGIGGKWGSDVRDGRSWDGRVIQWQDLAYTADANYRGAHRVISIETADNAPQYAAQIEEWTPRQVAALVRLIRWLCSREAHAACPSDWQCHKSGIPMTLIPDTKPGRRGIAYHAQGIEPALVAGGELWSTARGKECPGPVRIKQLRQEVIPLLKEDIMTISNDDLRAIRAEVIAALRTNIAKNRNGAKPDEDTLSLADFIEMNDQKNDDQIKALRQVLDLIGSILNGIEDIRTNLSTAGVSDAAVQAAEARLTEAVEAAVSRISGLTFRLGE